MMSEQKAHEYTYSIHFAPELGGYVAHVAEFPELKSPAAATPQAAFDGLITLVVKELDYLHDAGRPQPLTPTH
ncbi:MAG: hypothetical protein SW019_13155 [Actinomycetota bacterium]|nr:hypothetical protein [Actinomycetota bacterium]